MSADNYNFVRRRPDGFWDVWLNLSASCEQEPQLADPPRRQFDSREKAVAWAEAQGYTEYGTEVDDGSESATPTPPGQEGGVA